MHLHFRTYGQGPPLLILHGLFGSLDNWHSISQKLAVEFQVFAIDQRNHGRSPHSPDMNYSLMARDLMEFMEAQSLARADLLGHSMGAKTAMQIALLYPLRVRKLIAADMAPKAYPPHHQDILAAMQTLDLTRYRDRHSIEAALAPAIPDLATRRFLLKNAVRKEDGSFYWQLGLKEIQANYARLGEAVDGKQPFQGPTLFIRGERSGFVVPEDMELIERLFPLGRLETMPGAGHLLHVENATDFLGRVFGFLREPMVQTRMNTKVDHGFH